MFSFINFCRLASRNFGVRRFSGAVRRNHDSKTFTKLVFFMVSMTSLSTLQYSRYAVCESDKGRSKPLSVVEFAKNLRVPIEKIRSKAKGQTPQITTSCHGNTHQLNISTAIDIDAISLLLFWSQVLGSDVNINSDVVGGVRQHALIAGDKRSSMILQTSPSGINVTLYKEYGFSLNDLDFIVKGYENSISSPRRPSRSPSASTDGTQIDPFFSFFPSEFNSNGGQVIGGVPDATVSPRRRTDGTDKNSSDPISALTSLGVEVFTLSPGEQALDWDALAGYSSIKDQIDETVILSVLHPEVYDEIATKTRINFESNRPKAVLLEGPPGTGKYHPPLLFICIIYLGLTIIEYDNHL